MSIETEHRLTEREAAQIDESHLTVPAPLTEYTQWICWHYTQRENGKWTKPPVAPFNGEYRATVDNSNTWRSYTDACAYHERTDTDTEGLGFVLTDSDPLAAVDLDDCYDPQTGKIEPWASDIIDTIDSYTEISPSGYGIRIFLIGSLPDDADSQQKQLRLVHSLIGRDTPKIEVYDDNRYLTITGTPFSQGSDTINDRCDELRDVYYEYVESDTQDDTETIETSEGDTSQFDSNAASGQLCDQRVLDVARNAKNSDRFTQLWNATDGGDDHSDGDFELCKILAFYTQDKSQIERLLRQSNRKYWKWDEICTSDGRTYVELTVDEALDKQNVYYTPHCDRTSTAESTEEKE
jgi:putative DNA primase/helicase